MLRGIVRANRARSLKHYSPLLSLVLQNFNPELFYSVISNLPLLEADCQILSIQDPKIPCAYSQHQYNDQLGFGL